MTTEAPPRSAPALRALRITQSAGTLLVILGLTVLTGWILRLPHLVQLVPGHIGMVFSTVLCFTLAGAALLIPGRRHAQTILGGLITLAAGAMLFQYLAQTDLGIDLSAFHAWLSDPNPTPGRMAPNTALAFLLGGMALMLMPYAASRASLHTIEILAFLVAFIGLTGVVGHALELEFLYSWHYARMAIHTAVGMIIFGIGLWNLWRQLPNVATILQIQTHNRIIGLGGSVFFTIALIAGLGGSPSCNSVPKRH